ncbi:MAG TPA: hypothetical protein PLW09_16115 [Candidatus Kapabacteria bacterium]|nr:hypothetical protein [Candidatus Kapabacteria bacterium]
MNIHDSIIAIVLIASLGFFASLGAREYQERLISRIGFFTMVLQTIAVLWAVMLWVINGANPIHMQEITLYATKGYSEMVSLLWTCPRAKYS